jgi:hypothetical protein
MSHRGFLVVALVAVLAAPVYGQRMSGRMNNGQGQGPNLVNLDGNVEMVGRTFVRMMSKANQSVLVTITSATKVQFVGKATPEFLRKDLAVEFTADVDKKHNVKEAITQLTIITLTGEKGPGLFAEGSASSSEAKSGDKEKFAFGGGAIAGGGGGDAAPTEKKKPAAHKAPAVQLPGTCVVRGTIKSLKAGKLIVNIGHGTLRAEVSDNVDCNVDMADLSGARKGDSISVRGAQVSGTAMMVAESVSIQGTEPLSGPKKKSLPAAKKRGSSKDSGDDAGDSKADKKAADKGS